MDEEIEREDSEKKEEEKKITTTPLIDIANAAAERMEKANKKTEELIDRQEQMDAKRALGGRAEAGEHSEPKEETPKEYAKRVTANQL